MSNITQETITVKELIEALQKQNPDDRVYVGYGADRATPLPWNGINTFTRYGTGSASRAVLLRSNPS